jgi:hypothetical protein
MNAMGMSAGPYAASARPAARGDGPPPPRERDSRPCRDDGRCDDGNDPRRRKRKPMPSGPFDL